MFLFAFFLPLLKKIRTVVQYYLTNHLKKMACNQRLRFRKPETKIGAHFFEMWNVNTGFKYTFIYRASAIWCSFLNKIDTLLFITVYFKVNSTRHTNRWAHGTRWMRWKNENIHKWHTELHSGSIIKTKERNKISHTRTSAHDMKFV